MPINPIKTKVPRLVNLPTLAPPEVSLPAGPAGWGWPGSSGRMQIKRVSAQGFFESLLHTGTKTGKT